jgi:hypothetical protein
MIARRQMGVEINPLRLGRTLQRRSWEGDWLIIPSLPFPSAVGRKEPAAGLEVSPASLLCLIGGKAKGRWGWDCGIYLTSPG